MPKVTVKGTMWPNGESGDVKRCTACGTIGWASAHRFDVPKIYSVIVWLCDKCKEKVYSGDS